MYLIYEAEAAIEAGELTVKNGEAREIYNVDTENVKDSGKTFLQVLGVKIELENADEKFLASCWTDNTEAVIGKPIKVQADLSNKKNPVSTSKPEPGCQKEIHSQNVDDSQDKIKAHRHIRASHASGQKLVHSQQQFSYTRLRKL